MLIIITEIEHALLRGVLSHLLIKRGPVITAFFGIDFLIEVVKLRMMLMDPVENTLTVIAAQIQILQPDEIALALARSMMAFTSVIPGKIGEMKQVVWMPAS